jgi:drug/metabolite transporter (DMT)-like permease
VNDAATSRAGTAYLLFGAALISFSPVLVRVADVGPTMAGFYRCLFGGLTLAAVVLVRRERFAWGRGALLLALVAAGLFVADLSLWHRSIAYIGPGLSTILANFQVFFLAAIGILVLRETVDWRFLVSVPLAVGGLFMLVGVDWTQLEADYRVGVIFGLVTAMTYSGYMLVLRRMNSENVRGSAAANLMIISFAVAAMMGLEGTLQGESFRIPNSGSWAAMIAYGVFCQALAWVLISRGLARVETSRAGLMLLLQPTLAFIWDIVLFDRPTGWTDGLGAALALTAIYLGTTSRATR